MCKTIYEGAKAEAFLSLFENDKTLWQIAKLVYVDGLTYSEVGSIIGYSERQIGRLCKKIRQIAEQEPTGWKASVVILQEYAEELVRNGVRIKESEVQGE